MIMSEHKASIQWKRDTEDFNIKTYNHDHEIRSYGPANYIYADGDVLFVHGHERRKADCKIAPPEIFKLCCFCQS